MGPTLGPPEVFHRSFQCNKELCFITISFLAIWLLQIVAYAMTTQLGQHKLLIEFKCQWKTDWNLILYQAGHLINFLCKSSFDGAYLFNIIVSFF